MKKPIQSFLKTTFMIAVSIAVMAVFAHFLLKQGKRSLQTLADTMEYNSSVYNAANYSELLLYAREGNMTSLVERLEHLSDVSLLIASSSTNAVVQALPDGPWRDIKEDRQAHPRKITGERSDRINGFLDRKIEENPQP